MRQGRRQEQHTAIRQEIKDTARRLMEREGTAGISMRAIGRLMGLTAPALYHYYPSREALITDLIADAFNALGEAMEQTQAAGSHTPIDQQVMGAVLAYRQWALSHPLDFQLIYGNPIPGYEAPQEITVPAAERTFRVMVNLIHQALSEARSAPIDGYNKVPPEMEPHLMEGVRQMGFPEDANRLLAVYLTLVGWSRIHGIIMLELFHHIQPVAGNVEALYRRQMQDMLQGIGYAA